MKSETSAGARRARLNHGARIASLLFLLLSGLSLAAAAQSQHAAHEHPAALQKQSGARSKPAAAKRHTFMRMTATVFGVSSPDNVYNIYSRILKIPGVDHFAFNMNTGKIVIDFQRDYIPSAEISEEDLDADLEKSGFRVEDVTLQMLPFTAAEAAHARKLRANMPGSEQTAGR